MRLKGKSNEIILQKQCYYTEKRKQLLKKSSYSVCRKPFNNKKLVYIIEELLNWYTLKRIVLKIRKRICIWRYILSFIHIGIQYTNYSPFSILAFNAARASISPREVLAATLFT